MVNKLTTRQIEIIHAIRMQESSLEEIAASLDISRQAAQKHLDKLLQSGLVVTGETVQTGGRPRQFYRLSLRGQELFPRQYAWFTEVLIDFLKENGGSEDLSKLLRKLAKRLTADKSLLLAARPRKERIAAIVQFMNTLGYVAQAGKRGEIIATNCVYHHVARAHPEICHFDIQLIETLSGENVAHTECMVRGGNRCRFQLGGLDAAPEK
jgi:predicted ArsR family transcriptional regulator